VVLVQLDQELEPLGSSGRKRLAVAVMRDTFKHHFKGKFEKVVQLKDVMNLYMTTEGTTAADMAQFGTCGVLFQAGGSRVGDHAYFARLAEHMSRPEVARAFYQFLMARPMR
jgi:hypothetical protein